MSDLAKRLDDAINAMGAVTRNCFDRLLVLNMHRHGFRHGAYIASPDLPVWAADYPEVGLQQIGIGPDQFVAMTNDPATAVEMKLRFGDAYMAELNK